MAIQKNQEYYLGLDIGTDSVGYAVTGTDYSLLKYRGEPMWGVMTFEAGNNAADRRSYRTARRRLDRRKQRLALLQDLFAVEIGKIDPNFFIRRKESILFPEDSTHGVRIFQGGDIADEEYHRRYPTIHHLILELMTDPQPHDIRLIYLACSWLIAHRGHFLFDIDPKDTAQLLDFSRNYNDLCVFLDEKELPRPWQDTVTPSSISEIMQLQLSISGKKAAFKERIYGGKAIPKGDAEKGWYALDQVISLLSGGTVKLSALLPGSEFEESVCLSSDDDMFAQAISALDEEQCEFLTILRKLSDCARLTATMTDESGTQYSCISMAKVAVYNRHKADLEYLKSFIRSYHPGKYAEVFRQVHENNYVTYSKHIASVKKQNRPAKFKWSNKDNFSKYLKGIVKDTPVSEADRPRYEDMLSRLEQCTFLPKQKDSDNRIVPQQLYRRELDCILDLAEGYLPMLSTKDTDGLTPKEKIQSIFAFQIPYFVGPLNRGSSNAWLVRKAEGKILPWNLGEKVDLDASEAAFIKRMTNKCTYLPGEDVLPEKSLLYGRFTVLNELNNLKVNGNPIPAEAKQILFTQVFCEHKRVTPKRLKECLESNGLIEKNDQLSGLDETIKSSLYSYHIFRNLLDSKKLTETQVEEIINHCAYSEDKSRLLRWLRENFDLPEEDFRYILRQNLKGFGRLSRRFLTQLPGGPRPDSEQKSILEWMWDTNENLMQLLSDRYTFSKAIQEETAAHYAKPENQKKLAQRLKDERLSGSVRRSIHRTLDVVQDVTSIAGAPKKIFVEMARGGTPEQKGKRTRSRKQQLLELYHSIATEDARILQQKLEDMGEMVDNRLQNDALFLYFLQMGKCMYTGNPIDLSKLGNDTYYNKDHIYPQSQTKDDSVLNNLVLVESTANGDKDDIYPVNPEIQNKQRGFWETLRKAGLMTEEKFRRLTRTTRLTDAEKMGFINRQLVETRQSTKAIGQLLHEKYPNSQIVYVKAGLVSEFRQDQEIVKCRSVNDLHHAKDAYLNIVVGNVYHERFNRQWFRLTDSYNVELKKIMAKPLYHGTETIWRGGTDIAKAKKVCQKNAVHLTRYAFCRSGGLFDQMPVRASADLVPLKKDLDTEKYGGYNKPTASFFVLAGYTEKKRRDAMLVPVELQYANRFQTDSDFAESYIKRQISQIKGGKAISDVSILLNGRTLKINTIFSFDGLKMALSGKSGGGRQIIFSPITPLILGREMEQYVKHLDSFRSKKSINFSIQLDPQHDHITREENIILYDTLTQKLQSIPFQNLPANPCQLLQKERNKFCALTEEEQIICLTNLLLYFQRSGNNGIDLSLLGGSKKSGTKLLNASLSNWKKTYSNVQILDSSPTGLRECQSENLLSLL